MKWNEMKWNEMKWNEPQPRVDPPKLYDPFSQPIIGDANYWRWFLDLIKKEKNGRVGIRTSNPPDD